MSVYMSIPDYHPSMRIFKYFLISIVIKNLCIHMNSQKSYIICKREFLAKLKITKMHKIPYYHSSTLKTKITVKL